MQVAACHGCMNGKPGNREAGHSMSSGIMNLTPEVAGSDVPEGALNILGLKGKQPKERQRGSKGRLHG